MAVMYRGVLIEVGPADGVYFSPLHPYTQALIAANPEPDPRAARARRSHVPKGELRSAAAPDRGCPFADRCPEVMDVCRDARPTLVKPSGRPGAHEVACHLYS